jgi:hypothetical protein
LVVHSQRTLDLSSLQLLTRKGSLMKSIIISRLPWIAVPMIIAMMVFPACSKRSMQGAGQGAATGAVVGAVGGMVSALVFGGNVGEAAARGAVYAGATGAAAGAMSGAAADSNQKKAQEAAELEALRKRLGDDAFQGLEALVQCKHEVAQGYGRTAAKSSNPDFALAGLWLQVISFADSRQEDQAKALLSDLVAKDGNLASESQAEAEMKAALQKLMDIRQKYNLPKSCG